MTLESLKPDAPKTPDLNTIAPKSNNDRVFLKEKLRKTEIRAELAIFDANVRGRGLNLPTESNSA